MKRCVYCKDAATQSFPVVVGRLSVTITLCERHYRWTLEGRKTTVFVCKHCGVEVISNIDHRPIDGRSHKTRCPRHHKYEQENP